MNRIFEGTNEINRLLIPGMLMKRAAKGTLPLLDAARRLQDELMGPPVFRDQDGGPWEEELQAVEGFKKAALMTLGLAMQRYGEAVSEEQEVLVSIADIIITVACAESALLRAMGAPASTGGLHGEAARLIIDDGALRIDGASRHVVAAIAEGDALRTYLAALKRLLKVAPINTVLGYRRLADETLRSGAYIFQ